MIDGLSVGIAVPAHLVEAFLREIGEINPARQRQSAESMIVQTSICARFGV
jgi:hypothetical protein